MAMDFGSDVRQNPINSAILSRWNLLDLPNSWLVAGCLFQTVWNIHAKRSPGVGIKDYDIFYFDSSDVSEAAEADVQSRVDSLLADLGVVIEVANQARVHLWYSAHFGEPYPQLTSVEDGVDRFLIRETCVAVRPDEQYAPYGIAGAYAGTLTPNPLTPHRTLFVQKAASYCQRWEWLRVQPEYTVRQRAAAG